MRVSEAQTSHVLNQKEDPQTGEEEGRAATWKVEEIEIGRVTPGPDPWVHFRGELRVQREARSKGLVHEQQPRRSRGTGEAHPSRDMQTSLNELGRNLEGDARSEMGPAGVARTWVFDLGRGVGLLNGARTMRGSREGENLHHQRRPRQSLTRCSRGKISPYLTAQHSHYRYPYAIPPERQRSMIDLRVTDDYKVNQRRSMAVGPFEDLPPHLRNHLVRVLIPLLAKNSIVFASMFVCVYGNSQKPSVES